MPRVAACGALQAAPEHELVVGGLWVEARGVPRVPQGGGVYHGRLVLSAVGEAAALTFTVHALGLRAGVDGLGAVHLASRAVAVEHVALLESQRFVEVREALVKLVLAPELVGTRLGVAVLLARHHLGRLELLRPRLPRHLAVQLERMAPSRPDRLPLRRRAAPAALAWWRQIVRHPRGDGQRGGGLGAAAGRLVARTAAVAAVG